jgi:hypothetical protein
MPSASGTLSPEAIWDRLSLRRNDRALLTGGTRSGKSTLGDFLGMSFTTQYRSLGARRMILDTKPRFRAQWTLNGRSAKHLYKKWSHGAYVPDSVLVDDPRQLDAAWNTGHRTVIVQAKFGGNVPLQVACLQQFLDDSRFNRPQLVHVDETLDFFHGNGQPRYGDAILRLPRAGAERGTGSLFCSQRTKGFNPAVLELINVLYAFRLDFEADAHRFQEFGCPPFMLPTEDHEFMFWSKQQDRRRVYGPFTLTL